MYLISVYFDDVTNKRIQGYIDRVAASTGNSFMLDNKVPPHLTVSAFETRNVEHIIPVVKEMFTKLSKGNIKWVSIGQFFPYVIFLSPVLDEYLHGLCKCFYKELSSVEGIKVYPYYQPFQWAPHATIGKTLTTEQMQRAFEVMQHSFGVFEGHIVEIGLARTNPHEDLIRFRLDS